MCRMFGLVARQAVPARALLRDAPRSLQALAREHRDGWGVALRTEADWLVHRGTACAGDCSEFEAVAERANAHLLVAHVRQKTVGDTALRNTHPFRQGAFVFAHNGSITEIHRLVAGASTRRLAQIEGDTDSERLFAFVLTRIDDAGDVERGVVAAVRDLHALGPIGSSNFLLSCGVTLYAHRLGRSLFALSRHAAAETRRTASVVIASERLTDEPWRELADRTLVMVDHASCGPRLRTLLGPKPCPDEDLRPAEAAS